MPLPASDDGKLTEVGSGVFAYLQRGGWGMSNAGLVLGDAGDALLVDTLYDLAHTRRMLEAARAHTERIGVVVNTHANGDHCWGNQLVRGARIVSSRRAADEMRDLPPARMAALVAGARVLDRGGPLLRALCRSLGRLGVPRVGALAEGASFAVRHFGAFDFRGISLTLPTETFEDRLTLEVGGREVRLFEVGPAHTKGDSVVHLPRERIAFSGDVLFIGSHPIMWEGPVSNWIAACDKLLELDVDVVVPGHGPLTDREGVRRTKAYWERLLEVTRRGHEAGLSAWEIARELYLEAFDGWTEKSRLAVNVDTLFRELARDTTPRDPVALVALMARLEGSPNRP